MSYPINLPKGRYANVCSGEMVPVGSIAPPLYLYSPIMVAYRKNQENEQNAAEKPGTLAATAVKETAATQ